MVDHRLEDIDFVVVFHDFHLETDLFVTKHFCIKHDMLYPSSK